MTGSVALATFNGTRYLSQLLASLAAQTRLPNELVACDDASTDGTVPILEAFAATAPFPVRLFRNPTNLGSTATFERAFGLCRGELLFPCDQDDIWKPWKVERFADVFTRNPATVLVASDLEIVGEAGEPLGRRVWPELPFTPAMQSDFEAGRGVNALVRYNVVTGAAMAFRASLRDRLLPIPAAWVHDGWAALIASAVGGVELIREPSVCYREHGDQQIGSARRTAWRQLSRARAKSVAECERAAEAFAAAAERLADFPDVARLLRAKAAFARIQQRMREGPRLARFWPAVGAWVRGDYGTFARGWRSFAADMLL